MEEVYNVKEISNQIGIKIEFVRKVIWRLRYNKSSISDVILLKRFEPDVLLCDNYEVILNLFKPGNYCQQSLYYQYSEFKSKNKEFEKVSFKRFTWFCKNIMGMKYSRITRIKADYDSNGHKKSRFLISLFLLQLIRKKFHIIFYDSSTLCESNFKNHVWKLENGNNSKSCLNVNKIFGSSSILLACTMTEVINFWITSKNNKLVTTSFLYETILKYRKRFKNKILIIFLDNATMHYSKEVSLLAEKLGVYLFFNAPYSSKINLVEYVFEKLKRRIRQKIQKRSRTNLQDILFREMANYIKKDSKIETRQFYKEIHYALQLKNMWSTHIKKRTDIERDETLNG